MNGKKQQVDDHSGELEALRRRVADLEAENRKLSKELAAEKNSIHALMEYIPDTIYFKDAKSCFTRVNKAQAEVLGLSDPIEAEGKSDFDFFPIEHASAAYADEQHIIKSGKSLISKIEKIRRADGKYRYVSATKVPIADKNGKITGIVGISRDITSSIKAEEKKKKYTEELTLLNSSKDKFFSIIAHDLKSPFTALLGSTELLSSNISELTAEEIKIIASNTHKSADCVFKLLEDLLQWAKLQSGRTRFNPVGFDINRLIDSTIEIYRENLAKKQISLDLQFGCPDEVYADADTISVVIRNLLSNAVKFTYPHGKISVTTFIEDDEYCGVSISDDGIGIPEENLRKLFKIDEHVTTPGTSKEKGNGLGLILCHEFIEKNGGSLSVESTPGNGSEFTFFVPLKKDNGR